MYTVSQPGLDTWEGSLVIEGGPAQVSQEGKHLVFIIFKLIIINAYFFIGV